MYSIERKPESGLGRLQDELETKYGPAVAQDVVDRIRKAEALSVPARKPDYMDVKALSELAERFRGQAMMAVWKLRTWRTAESRISCAGNLVELEGVFLQRQCEDAIILYRQANKAYWSAFRDAMAFYAARSSTADLEARHIKEAHA